MTDRNEPYDSLDKHLTGALRVIPWIAVGMTITAVLIFIGKHF